MHSPTFKVVLIAMSGVRVFNKKLFELGLTLPGFVERSRVIASLPSLGLLTLAAHTPPNWEIYYREIDECTDRDVEEIISISPNIVAFSSLTARINETYRLSKRYRQLGITVVIGGLHASALPDEVMQHADSVIQGEGEIIWETLLRDYAENRLRPLYSSLEENRFVFHLSESKVPRYDLLDISKYNRLTLQTTRGCPLSCHFCAASRTISKYKKKPISQVERELEKIFDIWPQPFIELADDNTFVDKNWSKQLMTLFSKYKMRWFTETDVSVAYDDELLEMLALSGCAQVLIGFETATPVSLAGIDKAGWKLKQYDNYLKSIDKIQSYGISVNGCFILGFDTDTSRTFELTEQFVKESNLTEVQITLLTPFPGTELFYNLKNQRRLIEENFWDKCTLFDVNFIPENFTVEELESSFEQLMSNIYRHEAVANRRQKFREVLRNRINLTSYEYHSNRHQAANPKDNEGGDITA